jgi:HSP20 family protein
MSLTKWKKDEELFPSMTSFFDDFWGKDLYSGVAKGTTVPAVNIHEDDNNFMVEVAAPGLKKEDFTVDLENNVLTISAEHEEEKEEKKKKVTLREFNFTSFKRSFTVPNSVYTEKIKANYKDGVLHLLLPKKEESKKIAPKHIAIE